MWIEPHTPKVVDVSKLGGDLSAAICVYLQVFTMGVNVGEELGVFEGRDDIAEGCQEEII